MALITSTDGDGSPVTASWERCEREHNLVRDTAHPILRLQSSEVAPRRESMMDQIGGRQDFFAELREIALIAGHCLVLSDSDGVLIQLESKNKGHSEFERYGIALGSCWDERIAGTNGVAMAMAHNEAFTVRGKDHFFSKLTPFACTAVPLLDAHNQTIGAVNLSTIDKGNAADYLFARYALNATAERVQRILFETAFQDATIVTVVEADANDLLPAMNLVAVGQDGAVVGGTSKVHRLVGAQAPSDIVGRSLEDVFGGSLDDVKALPGRVVSTRFDKWPSLRIGIQAPNLEARSVPGWTPEPAKSRGPAARRRLPPSLRDLALGGPSMESVIEQASQFFSRALPLVLDGETGTGKSALLAALHHSADAQPAQCLTIDCASLSDTEDDREYLERIIQQCRMKDHAGLVAANDVTLVFEGLENLPSYGQHRLSVLLREREDRDDTLPGPRVRVVATVLGSAKQSVAQGHIHSDLFYLMNGARFTLPPLRNRERIDLLAKAVALRVAGEEVEITPEALADLKSYAWPGNVRELSSVLRQSLLSGDGHRITRVDLRRSGIFDDGRPTQTGTSAGGGHAVYDERTMIADALASARWNVARAARDLGIGRATLNRKMKQYGISRPKPS